MTPRVPQQPLQAVLFDLDGTLYDQPPLRWCMLKELAFTPLLKGPRQARRLARVLGSFRKQREGLRERDDLQGPLAAVQYEVVAERLDIPAAEVAEVVEEWMFSRPLKHLKAHRRQGVLGFVERARAAGLALGVFSDYPVSRKLEAMGLGGVFDCELDATDPEIDAFKPDPKGFLVLAQKLGVEPGACLYVGDRADVDAEGARRAGMRSVLIDAEFKDDGHCYAGGFEEVWRVVQQGL